MPEEKKTDYLELAKKIYARDEYPSDPKVLATIAIAEELRRLNALLVLFRGDAQNFQHNK